MVGVSSSGHGDPVMQAVASAANGVSARMSSVPGGFAGIALKVSKPQCSALFSSRFLG